MNRVDQLKSLLEGRGVLLEVADELLGGAYEVNRLIRLAREQGMPRIMTRRLCDGSEWVFRGNRQADEENRRAGIRMKLEPYFSDGEIIGHGEIVHMFRGTPIGPVDEVLREAGYYCDPVQDEREGLPAETGGWYRFVGYEMPPDLRWMCMKEIRMMREEGMNRELAWNAMHDSVVTEGITRTWFDNCWAVVTNGQSGLVG